MPSVSKAKTTAVTPIIQKMKISKTKEEHNMKSIRFLLLTITMMFLLISVLMIVLGISVYSYYHDFTLFYTSTKSGHFLTPSVLCVFVGMVLMVVSLFGFFGSLKQSTCMVNFYAFFLTIIIIIKLVMVILAFTFGGVKILDYISIPVNRYDSDPEIAKEIDTLQSQLECCGGYTYLEYKIVDFTSNHSTVIFLDVDEYGSMNPIVIPSSCCRNSGEVYCDRPWFNGCIYALLDVLEQNSKVLGVIGVSVMFINLLGIIFAILLARCIRKMKSQKAMQMWKIREQILMAREVEAQMKTEQNNVVFIEQQASSTA